MTAGLHTADLAMLAVAVLIGAPLIGIDIQQHRLPNRLTAAAAVLITVVALIDSIVRSDWSRWLPMLLCALGMAAAGYLLAVLSPDGLGLGDVKLLGAIGLALGHLDASTVVLWLLALAVCSALWLLLAPWLDRAADRSIPWRKRHVAFGPPMIVAWWLVYAALIVAWLVR